MALRSSQTPKCSSSRTGSIRVRRAISRLPVLSLALAILTGSTAAAAEPAPLSRHIIRCAQEPPPQPPTAEPSAESQPAAPIPGPPAEETTALDEVDLFARVGRLLQARCAMPGCHLGPDARQGMSLEIGRIYRSSVNVRARTEPRLLRVAPRAPEQSLLYLRLLPPDEAHYRGPRMPLKMNPPGPEEIALVRRWIEAFPADRWGAPPAAEAAARPLRTFHDSALVNLPTSDPLGRHTLEFRILHRFKTSVREAGSYDFYGLDRAASISIGLAYGLGETVEVGLRRTDLQHDYEGYSKWVLIRQGAAGAPLSLALRGSVSNLRERFGFNRNRYGAQAVLARRFGDHLSLMLVPTYVTRTTYLDEA